MGMLCNRFFMYFYELVTFNEVKTQKHHYDKMEDVSYNFTPIKITG